MRYNNYHSHTHKSSIFTPDTYIKIEDYCKRIVELGHDTYFTTEHGFGGDIFEAREMCDKYGLKCKFGLEGYIVKDPLGVDENEKRDASNYHIVIIPKTNIARKKVNKINSRAHKEGFYYKPRIFLEDLLTLDKNDVIITTACVAGFVKNKKGMEEIFMPLYEHFGNNLFLEVQSHNHINQVTHNEKILDLQQKYGLNIISANDSHYIYPQDASKRELLLAGKHIKYDDEGGFILDYPDIDILVERYRNQGVLNEKQITEAIENTLVFDDFEPIDINKESKMPNIYPDLTEEERYDKLEKLTWNNFYNMIVPEDRIEEQDLPKYKEKLAHCLKVVKDTMEMQTQDYFLLDEKLVNLAIDKYGGVLTRSSRGSAGAFYLNRVLNLTQLDSDTTDIPMYPDRFMSVARTLENRSYPDLDLNVVDQEPFVKASKELLGEFGCYPMVAYGTMGLSESFRNVCRSKGMEFDEFNEVGKEIEKHENDSKWKSYIDEAKELVGTVVSASIHPCSYLLFSGDIEHELGVIRVGKAICTPITSNESDDWKYLKNDYLIVSVWEIISNVFERIGIPIMSLKQLRESVDKKTWDIYSKGLTCTVNQVDSDWGTSLAKRYKPRSIDEVAMLTAAIRPSFDSWRDSFINREDFTNHNKYMDDLLKSTNKYILFQENLMQYFEWLGISPAESIGLIKKISKKKIKKEDFDKLVDRIKEAWVQQTGNIEGFYENWEMIQNCMAYSFNCVSGNTRLMRSSSNNKYKPTIKEMYNIMNSRQYAIKSGHYSLYTKYHHCGYGFALSMFEDGRLHQNQIVGISYAGIKSTYKVITKTGKSIVCTDNHKFPTPNGKFMLKDLKIGDILYCAGEYDNTKYNYTLTNGDFKKNFPQKGELGFQEIPNGASVVYDRARLIHVLNKDCCEICGKEYSEDCSFEQHHKDGDSTNNCVENYLWLCNSCHKKEHYRNLNRNKKYDKGIPVYEDEIVSIEYQKEEDVYDISMLAPAHNFLTDNGLVTSNSPHAIGYGYDSVYCAYLKSHYPLEYYSVVLNIYQDDQVRTSKLISEMAYFKISLKNILFGFSKGDYGFDKKTNSIYKGIKSIKFMNSNISDELYALSSNKYKYFVDLLKDIADRTSVNSRQLEILIKLDYFREFGNSKLLWTINKKFVELKQGEANVFKQESVNEDQISFFGVMPKSLSEKYKSDPLISMICKKYEFTEKTSGCMDILRECEEYYRCTVTDDFSIGEKIEVQNEYVGYVDFCTHKPEDRTRLLILDIFPLRSKKTNEVWANKLKTCSLGTGKPGEILVYENVFQNNPLSKYDVINVNTESLTKKEWQGRTSWYLNYYNIEKEA